MRQDLYTLADRMYVPIEQIAVPSDLSIFGTHFGESTYYADFAGVAKKYAPRRILEIGVRFGYSGIAMTSGALAGGAPAPLEYVGCDAEFFSNPECPNDSYALYRSNAVAAENFKRFRPGVDAEFYTCDTRRGLPEAIAGRQFDLINVDGDHSYEGAFGDLQRVWPLLAPGGVIIVDDTGMVDVKRACEEFRDLHRDELEGFCWHANERGFAIFLRKAAAVPEIPVETPLAAQTPLDAEIPIDRTEPTPVHVPEVAAPPVPFRAPGGGKRGR